MNTSVIICSHNSRLDYLQRVLASLREQTVELDSWELVLVDNASRDPLAPRIDLSWHPHGSVVRNPAPEEEARLVDARILGMDNTSGETLIFVDDDNVLDANYLEESSKIAKEQSHLGAWGGQIILEYEDPALKLPPELEGLLCFRSLSEPFWSNQIDDYRSTPWGAGLCIRRVATDRYRKRLRNEPDRSQLDPCGRQMRFGGDTDLVTAALLLGLGKGVFPQLRLTHLIPQKRCDIGFLKRCLEAHGYSQTLHGWLDRGYPTPPRNDFRYWVNRVLHWPARNRWQRMIDSRKRKGEWRAYHELREKSPRGFGNQQSQQQAQDQS